MGDDVEQIDIDVSWLWEEAAASFKRARRPEDGVDGMRRRAYAQGKRDGLITALCIATGREAEDIYETLTDELIARHEASPA